MAGIKEKARKPKFTDNFFRFLRSTKDPDHVDQVEQVDWVLGRTPPLNLDTTGAMDTNLLMVVCQLAVSGLNLIYQKLICFQS